MAPTSNPTPKKYLPPKKTCGNFNARVQSVVVDFEYTVETEESTTPEWAEQKMNRALQVAMVNSLAESHCPRRRRRDRQLRQRKLEVAAIAANTTPERLGSCEMTETKSKSCLHYKGYLTVDYTSEGGNSNETDVVNSVRSALRTNMDGDFYLPEVNAAIVDSGFVLTNIAYFENNNTLNNSDTNAVAGFQSGTSVVNENGLSALEKGMIGLGLVALLLLLLLLICCCRRRRSIIQNTVASEDNKLSTRSIDTDGSSVDGKEYKSNQLGIQEADYNHLGARHTRLDVHNCKSASCTECVSGPSRSRDKQVKFVPLATHGPLATRMFQGDGRTWSKGVSKKPDATVEATSRRQVVL